MLILLRCFGRDGLQFFGDAQRPLTLQLGAERYTVHEDETLHTEYSRSYTIKGIQAMVERAGFKPGKAWTDATGWFAML